MKYNFYIAGPLFSKAEKDYNLDLCITLEGMGYKVFLPTDAGTAQRIFDKNLVALNDSENLIAICDGADMDSGTAWECGRFYGKGEIYAVRTDFRKTCDDPDSGINLMIGRSATRIFTDTVLMVRWIQANKKY